jgi:hypothetical protein
MILIELFGYARMINTYLSYRGKFIEGYIEDDIFPPDEIGTYFYKLYVANVEGYNSMWQTKVEILKYEVWNHMIYDNDYNALFAEKEKYPNICQFHKSLRCLQRNLNSDFDYSEQHFLNSLIQAVGDIILNDIPAFREANWYV